MARPQEINEIQIIDNAIALIEEEGVSALSMRTLAIKCNIATSTLYLHFSNKLDLVIAVASKFWEGCYDNLDLSAEGDFFEAIKLLYLHILEYLERFNVSWLGLFSSMKAEDKLEGKKAMGKYIRLIHSHVISQLQKHKDEFDVEYYEKMGEEFFASFIYQSFVGMLMKFDHKYENFESILKRILLG